jgi:hypothetical protein
MRVETAFIERKAEHRRLACPGVAEQSEHLLGVGSVIEPVLDGGDGPSLDVGWADAHTCVSQQRSGFGEKGPERETSGLTGAEASQQVGREKPAVIGLFDGLLRQERLSVVVALAAK